MNTISRQVRKVTIEVPEQTLGMDVGDRMSQLCVVDAQGDVRERFTVRTHEPAIRKVLARFAGARIVLEVGTHSPWLSRVLRNLGLEVFVCNARKVSLIARNHHKTDKVDAELLARLGRHDVSLLFPIQHRGPQAQADLAMIRSRDLLVRMRSASISHVRAVVKSVGQRLPACSAPVFSRKAAGSIPEELRSALVPLLTLIAGQTAKIAAYDRKIENLCAKRYPETGLLRQVRGVGALTALAYVLTLEDPRRFAKSRSVGAYLGLTSRERASADSRPQLRISKAGDPLLRRLLVQCAHYIMGHFGTDCDLRRHGEAICAKGGKNAKKRAVVAVARKLAVLLHRLWVGGQAYQPDRFAGRLAA